MVSINRIINVVEYPMSAVASEWKPIETAPKDCDILVYNGMTGAYRTRFNPTPFGGSEWPCYFWRRPGTWYPQPTHWMSLPQP